MMFSIYVNILIEIDMNAKISFADDTFPFKECDKSNEIENTLIVGMANIQD